MTPADRMRIADLEQKVHELTAELIALEWQALFNSGAVILAFLTMLVVFLAWTRPIP